MPTPRRKRTALSLLTAAGSGVLALLLAACSGTGASETPTPTTNASTDLFVKVAPSVDTPPDGRVAVPIEFGWTGDKPRSGGELRLTVANGFTWATIASLGSQIDEQTVVIPYAELPQNGMTKARLQAPDGWNADSPILTAELRATDPAVAGGEDLAPQNDRGSAKAVSKLPQLDLFMFPPATRSVADASGVVQYSFSYGNQGSDPARATVELTLFDGYSWAEIPPNCVAANDLSPMSCELGEVPREAALGLKVKVPAGSSGLNQALKYDIKPVGATDENPANNNGVRYADSGPGR